jgi:hypothetical protein
MSKPIIVFTPITPVYDDDGERLAITKSFDAVPTVQDVIAALSELPKDGTVLVSNLQIVGTE